MTIGQRIFFLLNEKKMTQREFSAKTGIATTTISDWRKKNTNPGSDKVMAICAALEVTPEYLLSGVTEDSQRGQEVDYMVIPKGTDERLLLEMFGAMDWYDRARLIDYAKQMHEKEEMLAERKGHIEKIAEFCDIEVFADTSFESRPALELNYIDDDVQGHVDLLNGNIEGEFSKYVKPAIEAWVDDNLDLLMGMWRNKRVERIPEWGY